MFKRFAVFGTEALLLRPIPKQISAIHAVNIHMKPYGKDSLELNFPNLVQFEQEEFAIDLKYNDKLEDLCFTIAENAKQFKGIKAYTLDAIEISLQTKMNQLDGDNFYLVDDNNNTFLVNNDDYVQTDSHQEVFNYCNQIRLSCIQQHILVKYLKNFEKINQQRIGQQLFSLQRFQGTVDKNQLLANLLEAIPGINNTQGQKDQQYINNYQQVSQEFNEMEMERLQIEYQAKKIAHRHCLLMVLPLIGQFALVGLGSYHYATWDIIEPINYFYGSALGIGYTGLFCRWQIQKEVDNQTFEDHFVQKKVKKYIKNTGFDMEAYNKKKEEMEDLKKKMNSIFLYNIK